MSVFFKFEIRKYPISLGKLRKIASIFKLYIDFSRHQHIQNQLIDMIILTLALLIGEVSHVNHLALFMIYPLPN